MKQKLLVLLFFVFCSSSLFAQEIPLTEFRSVDDILTANSFGNLSLKTNYLDGQEVYREYTISTSTGYEVTMNFNLATKTTYIYTPPVSG